MLSVFGLGNDSSKAGNQVGVDLLFSWLKIFSGIAYKGVVLTKAELHASEVMIDHQAKKTLLMQEATNNKRFGLIFLSFTACLFVFLYYSKTESERQIEGKGVYVIGRITYRQKLKNGIEYTFRYQFDQKVFKSKFSTVANEFLNKDSLLFLKILPNSPESFKYVEFRVPTCLLVENWQERVWDTLPNINCK